ncbi:hypothetical protein OPQ81_010774 [Rhizoctonia solani]|nr:hypothetical protein OPQ81_010774 [Rhizoctonia solani]
MPPLTRKQSRQFFSQENKSSIAIASQTAREAPISRPLPLSDEEISRYEKFTKSVKNVIIGKTIKKKSSAATISITRPASQDEYDPIEEFNSTQEARDEYRDFEIPTSSPPETPNPQPEAAKEPTTTTIDTALPNGAAAIVSPPEAKNDTSPTNPAPIDDAPIEPERSGSVTPIATRPDPAHRPPPTIREETPATTRFSPEYYAAENHPWNKFNRDKDPSNAYLRNLMGHVKLDVELIIRYLNNRWMRDRSYNEHNNTIRFIEAFRDIFENAYNEIDKFHREAVAHIEDNSDRFTNTDQDFNTRYPDNSPTPSPEPEQHTDTTITPSSQPDQDERMEIDPITQEIEKIATNIPEIINPAPTPAPAPPKSNDPAINFLIEQFMNQNRRIDALEGKYNATNEPMWGNVEQPEQMGLPASVHAPAPPPSTCVYVPETPKTPAAPPKEPVTWADRVKSAKHSPSGSSNPFSPTTNPKPMPPKSIIKNVSATGIANAIAKGNKTMDEATDYIKYVVKFEVTPYELPEPQRLVSMLNEQLKKSKFGLGKGALVHTKWSGKGNLTPLVQQSHHPSHY